MACQSTKVNKGAQANQTLRGLQRIGQDSARFKATGNEPFWFLELGPKDAVYLNFLDGNTYRTQVPVSIESGSKDIHFTFGNDSDTVSVQIIDRECTDNMSGFVFPYTVTIDMSKASGNNRDVYTGCGKFL